MTILVLAIGLHEYGHAKFADMAGDPTPRSQGRVTLNPLKHLDPVGSIMMVFSSITGIGIGWGKPVMVRPDKMHNPRWDHFVSVLAGPMMNFIQAVIFSLIVRLLVTAGVFSPTLVYEVFVRATNNPVAIFLVLAVLINVSLFIFNLIPIGPLDGHWLVGAFMPDPMRLGWYRFNRGLGSIIFLLLVLVPSGSEFDFLGRFFFPIVMRITFYFLGVPTIE
jgi:Zn-dependent protease